MAPEDATPGDGDRRAPQDQNSSGELTTKGKRWTFCQPRLAVLKAARIPPAAKLCYVLLESYVGKRRDRTCFPSVETLAREIGCSASAVKDSLWYLGAIGVVIERGRRHKKRSRLAGTITLASPEAIDAIDFERLPELPRLPRTAQEREEFARRLARQTGVVGLVG